MKISVAIVDDHPLIRRGIIDAINEQEDLSIVWAAEDAGEADAKLRDQSPQVLLLDLMLADSDGLDLIKVVRSGHPEVQILVSSMRDENVYAARCVRAGAAGFVSKSKPVESLIDAIRQVAGGGVVLDDQVSAQMLRQLNYADSGAVTGVETLSDRELLVFELIGNGKSTQEIATRLDVSTKTVDSFRERIKQKMLVSTSRELAYLATRWVIDGASI